MLKAAGHDPAEAAEILLAAEDFRAMVLEQSES
jgi:hypothetical protein